MGATVARGERRHPAAFTAVASKLMSEVTDLVFFSVPSCKMMALYRQPRAGAQANRLLHKGFTASVSLLLLSD